MEEVIFSWGEGFGRALLALGVLALSGREEKKRISYGERGVS